MTQDVPRIFELPSFVNLQLKEALQPEQLQHLLRQFGNLSGAVVTRKTELEPWRFTIEGALFIYGEAHFWETEIDIRDIEGADNFLTLVNGLNASFEAAAKKAGRQLS